MEEESWKDIVGFEGYYQVSSHGRVRSLDRVVKGPPGCIKGSCRKGRVLIPGINVRWGYPTVALRKGKGVCRVVAVHILVGIHFIEKPLGKIELNHIDMNRCNAHYSNLEWVTHKENQAHSARLGKFRGRTNPNIGRKLTPAKADKIKALYAAGEYNQYELAKMFGVHQSVVSLVSRNLSWEQPA